MYDLAKMFLYCFNNWKLETTANHTHSSPTDDQKLYKENYNRLVIDKQTDRQTDRQTNGWIDDSVN